MNKVLNTAHDTPNLVNVMRVYEELLSPDHSHLLKTDSRLFRAVLSKHDELMGRVRELHGEAMAQYWKNKCFDHRAIIAKYGKPLVSHF